MTKEEIIKTLQAGENIESKKLPESIQLVNDVYEWRHHNMRTLYVDYEDAVEVAIMITEENAAL